jgi:hypothetical protein
MPVNQDDIEEALGITKCARCGQRLEGEIECPFCSLLPEKPLTTGLPKWIFITACFMTSPLSLFAVITTKRLNVFEKVLAFSGCLFWSGLYFFFFR